MNSTSIKPEPGKQFVERKQAGNVSVSGASKDSQRRGSNSSSVSSLSDIIQDIRISPHEAKLATENIPTKGKWVSVLNCTCSFSCHLISLRFSRHTSTCC